MALNRIAAHAALLGDAITLHSTETVLRDVLGAREKRITIEEIQRRVAAHYNIRPSEMASNRRAQAVVRPRHVAMYLAKQLTTRSLPEIGRRFGNRDHTTVMYAIRRIESLWPKDRRAQGRLWRCCDGASKTPRAEAAPGSAARRRQNPAQAAAAARRRHPRCSDSAAISATSPL